MNRGGFGARNDRKSMSDRPSDRYNGSGGGRGRGGYGSDRGDRGDRGDRNDRGRGNFRGGARGGRPEGRGGAPRGRGPQGPRGGERGLVTQHKRFPGVFVIHDRKTDILATRSLFPGESVYGEKRFKLGDGEKVEYRQWNPSRSKLAAAIINGISEIYIKPGMQVLYLGAASGTTVSHVADLVGPEGTVYAVEFSVRSGRELEQMAQKRKNVVPIIADARKPWLYRLLIPGLVDAIFSDVAQPDQSRIVGLNARSFLKTGGGYVISIKAACVDSTLPPEQVFANEAAILESENLQVVNKQRLEPFELDHMAISGVFRG